MADVDEDIIPRAGPSAEEDIDLSEETQDFRFLAAVSCVDEIMSEKVHDTDCIIAMQKRNCQSAGRKTSSRTPQPCSRTH